MSRKEKVLAEIKVHGYAYMTGADVATCFPGVYSVPNGECAETPWQQVEKFCWEKVLRCRRVNQQGDIIFWNAAGEVPKEQGNEQ
jgi:hypothetical protein